MFTKRNALALSSAAGALSKGVMFSVSALFFTTVVGLRPAAVGLVLTVAGVVGTIASYAAGRLCDRYGPRRVLLVSTVAQGLALIAYCGVRDTAGFALVACVALAGQGAQRTAQVTLVAGAVVARARLRVVTNVFVAVGSGAAAGALAVGTRDAYLTAVLTAGVLVLASAVPLRALPAPATPAAHRPAARPATSWRVGRRYLVMTGFGAVIAVQFGLLTVGMPLWVTGHTRAPSATVALLLVLNTVLVSVFQVPLSRRIGSVPAAAHAVVQAVVLLGVACVLYAAAAHSRAAVVVLVLAVAAHSFGEILSEAGGWELAFELADPRAVGTYQGVSQTGMAAGTALAPATVTATAIAHGTPGWLLLAALFLAAGLGTILVTRGSAVTAAAQEPPEGRRMRKPLAQMAGESKPDR